MMEGIAVSKRPYVDFATIMNVVVTKRDTRTVLVKSYAYISFESLVFFRMPKWFEPRLYWRWRVRRRPQR